MPLAFRAIHMAGVIFWIGGVVSVAMLAAMAPKPGAAALSAYRGVTLRVATPAMIVAWIGGLGMLLPSFTTLYVRQGWMHGKLGLVLLAAGLTGMLTAKLRKAALGEAELSASTMRALGLALFGLALIVVALAVFKPGS
ncbi:MAG: CopD family protein [Myxococcales bacterium]|nr:CopD family protein [Myxococcales bacterium]